MLILHAVRDACKDKYILFLNNKIFAVLNHIKRNSSAGLTESEIAQGIVAPQDFCNKASALTLGNRNLQGTGIFNLSMDEYNTLNLSPEEKELVKPFYTSTELHKYYGNENNTLWVIYTPSKFKNKSEMKTYPKLKAHLDKFAQVITSDNKPYGLHRARDEKFLEAKRSFHYGKQRSRALPTLILIVMFHKVIMLLKPNGSILNS